ncbi:caspase family protein [Methylobacterium frigidaeris]|uniref:caspase family protein n=1 Tax=Methylobacterium frigidaeris TaxID=2038277 RepID=UPI0013FD4ED1|nr:caspase family protein [Methylobacterium frigidaeris]
MFCVFHTYSLVFTQQINGLHAQEASHKNLNATSSVAVSVKRFALVIGNGNYRNVTSLKNARKDAAAIAVKLRKIGYEVIYETDLDRRSMNQAVTNFLARVEPASEALVYYAGHGVELNGSNYLLPVDRLGRVHSTEPHADALVLTQGLDRSRGTDPLGRLSDGAGDE